MTDTMWGFVGLGGIGLVALGNYLRFRRTSDRGCLGHFFVAAEDLTTTEQVLNRTGIAIFFTGVVLAIAL